MKHGIYCFFFRDYVKTYYVEKEEGSESDVEVLRESQSQSQEWEDQSHVHFSLDTSYKVKCEVSKHKNIIINLCKKTHFFLKSGKLKVVRDSR